MTSLHTPPANFPKKEQVCQVSAHGADPRADKKVVVSPRSRPTTAGNSPATSAGGGDDWTGLTSSPLAASSPVYLTRRTGSEDEKGGWGFLQTVSGLPDLPAPPRLLIGDAQEIAETNVLGEKAADNTPSRSTSACSSLAAQATVETADAPSGEPMYLRRDRVDGSPQDKHDALTPCFDGPPRQIGIDHTVFGYDPLRQPDLDGAFSAPPGIIGDRITQHPESSVSYVGSPTEHKSPESGGDILWNAIEHYLGVDKPCAATDSPKAVALGTTPCAGYPAMQTPVLRLSDALTTTGATPVSSIGVTCQPNQPQILSTTLGNDAALSPSSVLRLAEALPEPTLGSPEMPTAGSAGHRFGTCKPCAFMHTKGCDNGIECPFCHLCGPDELRRRKKERVSLRQNVLRLTKVLP